jgi:hypothetical protein
LSIRPSVSPSANLEFGTYKYLNHFHFNFSLQQNLHDKDDFDPSWFSINFMLQEATIKILFICVSVVG